MRGVSGCKNYPDRMTFGQVRWRVVSYLLLQQQSKVEYKVCHLDSLDLKGISIYQRMENTTSSPSNRATKLGITKMKP